MSFTSSAPLELWPINDRRFRWAQLSLQILCGLSSESDVRNQLGKLPPKLRQMYAIIYEGIISRGGNDAKRLPRILIWLMYGSTNIMKSQDFLDIVSWDTDNGYESINKSLLLTICGNLVEYDPKRDAFRIAHLSVREFLETEKESKFGSAHGNLSVAQTCLDHLRNCGR